MAPIVAENAMQCTVFGTQGSRTWANVIGGFITGAGTADGLADDIAQAYIDNIMPVLASTVTLSGARFVDLRDLDGESGPVSGAITFPVSGGGGNNGAPPQVAYLVTMVVGGGRTTRNGRMYLPGVNENEVDGLGVIDSDQVAGMQAAVTGFLQDVTEGDNGDVGVLGKLSTGDYLMRSVSSGQVQNRVATQRRRLRA